MLALLMSFVGLAGEELRPLVHFTAPKGWINDPNGLVYRNGEYHLFYQHNPESTRDGNKNWGHATSRDLIHWTDHGDAIKPDELGDIWSGSAVIDEANTAGFGKGAQICIYTAAGGVSERSRGKDFTQCLAYSMDGRHFTKYSGNPVLKQQAHENRDPKVIRAFDSWVMALWLRSSTYGLFRSYDMKHWTKAGEVDMPGTDECPDFYAIDISLTPPKGAQGGFEGNPTRWVFSGANGNYRVGNFDGSHFLPVTPVIRSHFGNTAYAGQTFSNIPHPMPGRLGRRISIEWMNGSEFPGCAWNQQMTFPNELTLVQMPEGPRLAYAPVREIEKIRGRAVRGKSGSFGVGNGVFEAALRYKLPASGSVTLEANGIEVRFNRSSGVLSALGQEAKLDLRSGEFSLRMVADKASLELYAQDGLTWMPLFKLPTAGAFKGLRERFEGDWEGKTSVWPLRP
jgi:sucrose-6-phosphate hydrolase SacC (GH32 family)